MNGAPAIAAITGWARQRLDRILAVLLFASCFNLLALARNHQIGDSRYTLLLSQNLISHREFALDRYNLVAPPGPQGGPRTTDYRLYRARGRVYYFFPAGASMLSIPYVLGARLLGGRPLVRADGTYDPIREEQMQADLAPLLMAILAVVMFFLARLRLPRGHSLVVALVMTFGTQVFSSASRALWSDTWGILLVGSIVHELLRAQVRGQPARGLWLATLASWAYFVRPTNVFVVPAIASLLVWNCRPRAGSDAALAGPSAQARGARRALLGFLAACTLWMAGFAAYSLSQFGALTPDYYRGGRLGTRTFFPALAGCLFSPGRGLFVYVPVVPLILFLVARYWRTLRHRALATAALLVCLAHTLMLGAFGHWWGGHSFGPRLFTGLVPWFALLAVLGLDAALDARRSTTPVAGRRAGGASAAAAVDGEDIHPHAPALWVVGGLLCLASVAINRVGATSFAAAMWNAVPVDVDRDPGRLWSWRNPQFLAGVVLFPDPAVEIPAAGLPLGTAAGDRYIGSHWALPEGDFRWTDGQTATLRFARGAGPVAQLELVLRPYLPPRIPYQRLRVTLNGHLIGSLELTAHPFLPYDFPISADLLRPENVLRFDLPDAASPASLEGGSDERRLGIAVRTLRLLPPTP